MTESESRPTTNSRRFLFAAMCLQPPLLLVTFFGDFGFYFPRSMGDFGDWEAWMLRYILVALTGMVCAGIERMYRLIFVQLAMPFLLLMGVMVYYSLPEPYYDAAKHQHLVGKTVEEVESILGRRRFSSSGLDGFSSFEVSEGVYVEYGRQSYRGMDLMYSKDRRVELVLPTD